MRPVFAIAIALVALGILTVAESAPARYTPYQNQAAAFRGSVDAHGRILDRARSDLPALSAEAEEARALNFERCAVGMDVYVQSGAVLEARTQARMSQFALMVDAKTWAQRDDQDEILELAQCYFAAGDSRVLLQIPIYDLRSNRQIGKWFGRPQE